MSVCPACKNENPAGSKFCAGCGGALPKMPVPVRCAACSAESPEGSRFCKGCGLPVGSAAGPAGQTGSGQVRRTGGASNGAGPKAPVETVPRIKMLLGAGAGLYAFAIYLMYSDLARARALYGVYAGQLPGTGFQWLLIVLDACLAAGNLYAISLVGKGDTKYARWLFAAMAGLGLIFLLRNLSGPVSYILLNAAVLAAGVWGWRLISQHQRALAS
jgi:hypothetical protein